MPYAVGNLIEKDALYRSPVVSNTSWGVRAVTAPGFMAFFLLLLALVTGFLYLISK